MSAKVEEPRIFQPGDAFRQYTVESFLGAGASGQVYAVRHRFTDDRFALKVAHLADRASAKKVARSLVEGRATYGLRHQNVVRVVDLACEDDGMVWQLMELLDGKTIAELLARSGRMSPFYAIDVALEVACGLQAAHEQRIIHRDVQPSNIFITTAGVVKVLDFGLAKVGSVNLQTTLTEQTMGSAGYMSPEHGRQETPTAQFDVYSLGIVLWQMLAGQHPFEDARHSVALLVMKHMKEDPASLAVAAGLPAYCDEVIRGATAKDQAKRYDGMWTFRRALVDLRERLAADPAAAARVRDVPGWERKVPIVTNIDGHQAYAPPRSLPGAGEVPAMPSARIVVPGGRSLGAVPVASSAAAAGGSAPAAASASSSASASSVSATASAPSPAAKHIVAVTMPMQAVGGPGTPAAGGRGSPATGAARTLVAGGASAPGAPVVGAAGPGSPSAGAAGAPVVGGAGSPVMEAPGSPVTGVPGSDAGAVPASIAHDGATRLSTADTAAPTVRAPHPAAPRRWWLALLAIPFVMAGGTAAWALLAEDRPPRSAPAPSATTAPKPAAPPASTTPPASSAPRRAPRPKR